MSEDSIEDYQNMHRDEESLEQSYIRAEKNYGS